MRAEFNEHDRERVFWWSPRRRFGIFRWENVGDYLAPVVVAGALARCGLRIGDKARGCSRLLAVGSVLHFARDGDTIWGVGRNGKMPEGRHTFSLLDVRAVRGPLTMEFLAARGIPCPTTYGDPALLLPQLYPELRSETGARRSVVVVPHFRDTRVHGGAWKVLRPTVWWRTFVEEIQRAEFVVSSSLHGIVVAEAFGIPARWLRVSALEHDLKYRDYYLGTGRPQPRPAGTIEEALRLGGEEPPHFNPEALMAAFPYDLWEMPADKTIEDRTVSGTTSSATDTRNTHSSYRLP